MAKFYAIGFIPTDTTDINLPSWFRWFWRVRTWEVSDNASGLPPLIVDTGIYAGGAVQPGLLNERELYEKRDQWVDFAEEGSLTIDLRSSYMDLGGYFSFVAADSLSVNPFFQYTYYSPDSATPVFVFPPGQAPGGITEVAGSTIILDGVSIPAKSAQGTAMNVTVTIAPRTFWEYAKTNGDLPTFHSTGAQLRSSVFGQIIE